MLRRTRKCLILPWSACHVLLENAFLKGVIPARKHLSNGARVAMWHKHVHELTHAHKWQVRFTLMERHSQYKVGSNSTCIAEESEEFCQLFSIRCFNEIPHTRQVRAQLFPQSLEHYKVNPVLEPEMEGGILKAGSRVSQKWPNR